MTPRDYEQDVFAASGASPERVRAVDFSWSCARHDAFESCPRRYFIRYYLAQGGWNPHADVLVRAAYFEKHIPPLRTWLSSTFHAALLESIRTVLRRPVEVRARDFPSCLMRAISVRVDDLESSLLDETYRTDPKLPAVMEFVRKEPPFDSVQRVVSEAEQFLGNACVSLIRNDFFHSVLSLAPPSFFLDKPFLAADFSAFRVWVPAGLLFVSRKVVTSLHCRVSFSDGSGEERCPSSADAREAALFSWYAARRWPACRTEWLRFSFERDATGFLSVPPDREPITDVISLSAHIMLGRVRPDATVSFRDFEPIRSEACASCQTCRTCAMLDAL